MTRRQPGLSLIEIDIALLLVALLVLALYSATASSIRLSRKDSLYTEAAELCQRQIEDVVLTAHTPGHFYLVQSSGPAFIGDYNGDPQYFVAVQTVQDITSTPSDFLATRLKKVAVQVFLAQPGPTPQAAGRALVQYGTVVSTL